VLDDPVEIAHRVVTMAASGRVTAIDGAQIEVSAESVCVHGDSPGAVQIATAVLDQLKAAGTQIRAFC
jgi:5-oxoprolinase (ATP-hydrolysing) subunit A